MLLWFRRINDRKKDTEVSSSSKFVVASGDDIEITLITH